VESIEIELGLERKRIELRSHFQPLRFDKATQRGEEMIGLGVTLWVGDWANETVCLSDL
jgi:hypothetical protein